MSISSQVASAKRLVSDVDRIQNNSSEVLDILCRVMDSSIIQMAEQFDEDEKTGLMECIFLGLAIPDNNGKLLKWFQILSESTYIGTIVRAVNSL